METIYNFLSKDGYSNLIKIILAVFGAIGWIIAFIIKRSYDKKDKRLTIYNDVLENFEKINQSFTSDFTKTFSQATTDLYIAIIQDPENFNTKIIEYFKVIQKYLDNGMNITNEIFSQFAKFRLVASQDTLKLFEKYKEDSLSLINETFEIQKQIFNSLSDLTSINKMQENLNSAMQIKGESLKELYLKLEKQMKKDIGF